MTNFSDFLSEFSSSHSQHNVEIYACDQSYEENYEQGPRRPSSAVLNIPDYSLKNKAQFLGFALDNPLGVAAGPLLNAQWVRFYLDFGFAVPVYKTVRSVFRACHPPPNCIHVRLSEQNMQTTANGPVPELDPVRLLSRASVPELQSCEAAPVPGQLSITNSFGVPSMSPAVWMPDVALAASYCQPAATGKSGQLLIVSVLGTEGAEGRNLLQDFAYTAAMAREAGAKVLEANFSCPNLGGSSIGMLYAHADGAARIAREIRRSIGKSTLLLLKLGFMAKETLAEVVAATRPYVDGYAGINTVSGNVRRSDGRPALRGAGRLQSGVCGAVIRTVARQFVRDLADLRCQRKDDFAIVGIGGMMTAEDLEQRLEDGADLVMSATAAMWDPYLVLRWLAQQELIGPE